MDHEIETFCKTLSIELPFLKKAYDQSTAVIKNVQSDLKKKFPDSFGDGVKEIDLVVHGSYARNEATEKSDFDNVIILHGSPKPSLIQSLIAEIDLIIRDLDLQEPGKEGLFGDIAVAGELYTRIGLESDTNVTTTRRILLLTESVSVFNESLHQKLIKNIIDRYCVDYEEQKSEGVQSKIPRFLLNDLIRYWRTIAVDFAAKRWRSPKKSPLRLAKLRISRKLMIAGALASVFLTEKKVKEGTTIREYLFQEFRKPSLARLAGTDEFLGDLGKEALKDIFLSYNDFLKIISNQDNREILNSDVSSGEGMNIWSEIQTIGEKVQNGLEEIFFSDPTFKDATKSYGLF